MIKYGTDSETFIRHARRAANGSQASAKWLSDHGWSVEPAAICPGCGQENYLADQDGDAEEFPREWHAECAHKAVEAGNDPRS